MFVNKVIIAWKEAFEKVCNTNFKKQIIRFISLEYQ